MRIAGAWLDHPGTQALLTLLEDAGEAALLVGGCVRDALLGAPPGDIDVATSARPDEVIDLAGRAGLKAVPTGIEHGTVTVLAEGRAHEVTTFRRDVETDGRHAVVRFSRDVAEDARRRDFTINALYAERSGRVIDPLGGLRDLRARRIRFIDDPAARIAEDHLRILRFFRFHAWYGDPGGGLDPEGLAACAAALDGLGHLSRERVGAEMLKLLAAPDPGPAVAAMLHSGVLHRVVAGAAAEALGPLVLLEEAAGVAPDPLRRLAALGGEGAAAALRLSRRQAARLDLLRDAVAGPWIGEIAFRHGAEAGRDVALLRAANAGAPPPPETGADIAAGAAATFPVAAADLMPRLQGAALGREIDRLERLWIDSRFRLTRDELLG